MLVLSDHYWLRVGEQDLVKVRVWTWLEGSPSVSLFSGCSLSWEERLQ